ncbi:L-alanine-DL-glutamate epimerase-like enolase superfamily enzyme [Constrictibacter sp. MBR-5]|uniref:N-acetyl-D-Glu racemase DgcA n=1 Tax=Constrictibacter sp. MBR-5 TaxID=3156467 RepID=UPI0033929491
MRRLTHTIEALPIRGAFTISRGSRTETVVIVVEITDGYVSGRGECVPYARYGETPASVAAQIEGMAEAIAGGIDRLALQSAMPAGAARNAVDCALWDLEAKRAGKRAWEIASITMPEQLTTAYTLSLDTPEAMATAAREAAHRPLLKLKLGGSEDIERVRAVRSAAPDSELIVDANEGWQPDQLPVLMQAMADLGVALIEQPLPAGGDGALAIVPHPVPVCADESFHDRTSLAEVIGRYDFVNIKLDKTGGLTEALAAVREAERAGLGIMVGCMLASSLSMAPATLVAAVARFVDLDGPLLLAKDRRPGLVYKGSTLGRPPPDLWG